LQGSPSSPSSSDREDALPLESLEMLTNTLKSAQSRAKSLSANFARLMRLVLDEEIEACDKDIVACKAGLLQALKEKEVELQTERETRKAIARSRLVRSEHEIDGRFEAMVDAEWQRFRVLPPTALSSLSSVWWIEAKSDRMKK